MEKLRNVWIYNDREKTHNYKQQNVILCSSFRVVLLMFFSEIFIGHYHLTEIILAELMAKC